MSDQQQRISWQYVVLAALGGAFLLGIFVLIPRDMAQGRTALLGLIVLAGQAAVAHFLSHRVDKADPTGDLPALIRQIMAEQTDVSRETTARHRRTDADHPAQ
jgi:hypothetical protein